MLRAWWQIRKATRAARRCGCEYTLRLKKARKEELSLDDIRDLQGEASDVVGKAWKERNSIVSSSLVREAELLNLPLPDRNDPKMWDRDDMDFRQRFMLTAEGITLLRNATREERQARGLYAKVVFTAVVSTIGAIAAIISAAAALLAIYR